MSNEVYANNMEVSCKQAAGKSICAFPDVCFTPPQTPATPPGVPIPYPNTGMASDTTDGSSSVKISGQEVMLKNKSYFKKSMGDEAGCAPKKGMISSKNMGKVYFNAWSMDVKFEGENVVRTLDLTTHNHGSPANEAIPWPYQDAVAMAVEGHPCKAMADNIKADCSGNTDYSSKCCDARKCLLIPKSPNSCCNGSDGQQMTPHHPIPVAELSSPRMKGQEYGTSRYPGYSADAAPCVCLEGTDHDVRDPASTRLQEHGRVGAKFAQLRNETLPKGAKIGHEYDFSTALDCGAGAVHQASDAKCDEACTRSQLASGHAKLGVDEKKGAKAYKSKQKAKVAEFKTPPSAPAL